MLREVVELDCVGGFRCASGRASEIYFQACSFNHSDISPFRINNLQLRQRPKHRIVSDLLMCRDHLRHFKYSRRGSHWAVREVEPRSRDDLLAAQRSCAIQSSCGPSRYGAKAISSRGDTPMYISYGRRGPKVPCVRGVLPSTPIDFSSPHPGLSVRCK